MQDITSLYGLIIENREFVKVFYGLIIGLICMIIVLKSDQLFKISLHQGIRYFRNAFLFYGVAFIIRYLIGTPLLPFMSLDSFNIIRFIFEYFLIMAGFFLLYSLLWKKIEFKDSFSSLFNRKIAIFYIMAFIIALLDYFWISFGFMFVSQIIVFLIATIISYNNYRKKGFRHRFLKFYFIAMVLSLIAWILNLIVAIWFDWNRGILINIYILNIIIFLLFLYGVVNITKKLRN